MAKTQSSNKLREQILKVLRENPAGLTIYEIRELIEYPGIQQHLDRRVRNLRKEYDVPHIGGKYVFKGPRTEKLADEGVVNATLRAAVLKMAHGRCQMCGRTVADDHVKLQADHKVPHSWGGPTTIENLWAICALCNGGKRDFFASFDNQEMEEIVALDNVHHRLARILVRRGKDGVKSWFLNFVANVNDFQEDWQRRIRELRVFGFEYVVTKQRLATGKVEATYTLKKAATLPDDPAAVIRQKERVANASKQR